MLSLHEALEVCWHEHIEIRSNEFKQSQTNQSAFTNLCDAGVHSQTSVTRSDIDNHAGMEWGDRHARLVHITSRCWLDGITI